MSERETSEELIKELSSGRKFREMFIILPKFSKKQLTFIKLFVEKLLNE